MARGQRSEVGDTRWSPNGYHYTRTEEKWELTHRLVAEKTLGRKLTDDERIRFKDTDRKNLSPENIVVYEKRSKSYASQRAAIQAKIDELQAKLEELPDD